MSPTFFMQNCYPAKMTTLTYSWNTNRFLSRRNSCGSEDKLCNPVNSQWIKLVMVIHERSLLPFTVSWPARRICLLIASKYFASSLNLFHKSWMWSEELGKKTSLFLFSFLLVHKKTPPQIIMKQRKWRPSRWIWSHLAVGCDTRSPVIWWARLCSIWWSQGVGMWPSQPSSKWWRLWGVLWGFGAARESLSQAQGLGQGGTCCTLSPSLLTGAPPPLRSAPSPNWQVLLV